MIDFIDLRRNSTDNLMSEADASNFFNNSEETDENETVIIGVNANNEESMATANTQEEESAEQLNIPENLKNFQTSNLPAFEAENYQSAFYKVIICPVCQDEYCTETGDPRTIDCGHNICSDCLKKILFSTTASCPVCRYDSEMGASGQFPVSLAVKSLIWKYKAKKLTILKSMFQDEHLVKYTSKEELKSGLGSCRIHSLPLHFGCTVCLRWLCGKCVCYEHSGPEVTCKVFPINEAIIRISAIVRKELESRKMKSKIISDNLGMTQKSITELTKEHHFCLRKTQNHIKYLSKKVNNYEEKNSNLCKRNSESIEFRKKLMVAFQFAELYELLASFKVIRKSFNLQATANNSIFKWEKWNLQGQCSYLKSFFFTKEDEKVEFPRMVEISSPDGQDLFMKIYKYGSRGSPRYPQLDWHFFNLNDHPYYAYIDVCQEDSVLNDVRLEIQVDNNALGNAFLNKCSESKQNSFKSSLVNLPMKNPSYIFFGEAQARNLKYSNKVQLGNVSKYNKKIKKGEIGLYNNFENIDSIHEDNMSIYINLTCKAPNLQIIPYITYGIDPKLRFCFGSVVRGLEKLESLLEHSTQHLFIRKSGIKFRQN